MIAFVPAYDTEQIGNCLAACREIVEIHRTRRIPATFFIVGEVLEAEGAEYRQLLDEPELFEIASHTYSHKTLRDHPFCGPAVSADEAHVEIHRGKEMVEQVFERPCIGMRPACGFDVGLRGADSLLNEVTQAGFGYISSHLWGPEYSLPVPLRNAYTYADEGHRDLWELPAHGWHENILKGHNLVPSRAMLWPPIYPQMQLPGLIETPEEEFEVDRFFIDQALRDKVEYLSLIWHPWSLGRFDPQMRMLDMVFDYAAQQDVTFMRFDELWRARTQSV